MVRRAWTLGRPAAVALVLLSLAPVCAPGAGRRSDTLTIAAYSVIREALHDGLLPAFAAHWKQQTGRTVRFEESYNGSGAQVRAITSGFDADIAVLALEGDIGKLVKAGLVSSRWNGGPGHGMITHSLVVIGHRAGNPKGIRNWVDLTQPGVSVVYADPKTSGGARWNINAIYAAGLVGPDGTSRDPAAGRALLAGIQANVVTMDASGRQSMATFERGTGDAIVTYENELLLQRKMRGQAAPYVIPSPTLLIEGPAAVIDHSVDQHGNRGVAEAFLKFLHSDEAQRILRDYGFRPLDPGLDNLADRGPLPAHLLTMQALGGWPRADREIYGPGGVWDSLFTGPGAAATAARGK